MTDRRRKGRGAPVPSGTLRRVEPQSIALDVLEQLRSAILTGRIPPGSRLREAETAEEFGVSRAPLREALRQLESVGLVESFPRRGAIVVTVPEREIEAVIRLRADIESRAFATVAEAITETELEELDSILEMMERARTRGDAEGAIAGDLQFHAAVMRFSGFVVLRQVWSNIDGLARVRAYRYLDRLDWRPLLQGNDEYTHARLVDALRRHDAREAETLARAHILEGVPLREPTPTQQPVAAPSRSG